MGRDNNSKSSCKWSLQTSKPVVPNRWVATPKWVAEEFVGSRTAASIVCWSLEFLELPISTFCYISKTETRTDLCEVHIISIIIPIWFLLYSLNQPDCRIESCAERVNPRGLRVPVFAGQVRESVLLCMRCGRRMGNSLCGQLNVEPKHMNLISSKIAKRVDVLKLFASNALRPVSPEQLLQYDVTTHSCETLAHVLVCGRH